MVLSCLLRITHFVQQENSILFPYNNRVRTGHGKPGKSWNFIISFSRPGKSWNLDVGHEKSWKIGMLSMSERQ